MQSTSLSNPLVDLLAVESIKCLARNIKARRESLSLPLGELAGLLGVSEDSLGRLESGRVRVLPLKVLTELADRLDSTIDELMEIERLKSCFANRDIII